MNNMTGELSNITSCSHKVRAPDILIKDGDYFR